MELTRRELILFAAQTAFAAKSEPNAADLVRAFGDQGIHRTGTSVDLASGDWLMAQVRDTGLDPVRETWPLNRVDPLTSRLGIGGKIVEGLPLFDGGFTDAQGITGRLGPLNSDAGIGFTDLAPNAADAGPLGEARRQNKHQAIVVVTRGARPGFCPSNADNFLQPFGPPVLQISSDDAAILKTGEQATVIAQVKRTPAQSFNVTATLRGQDRSLPPLIVMTPRSGWWSCASERTGGIICWLHLMRTLGQAKPQRDVIFVASSGHEVGYLGIEAFVANRPGIVKKAHAWIHFGANVAAARDPGNTVQSSDDDMDALETDAMTKAGLKIDRHVKRGAVPGGEAGVVHKGGGRYLSIIGRSALFHNPADRGAGSVDPVAAGQFCAAFSAIALSLTQTT